MVTFINKNTKEKVSGKIWGVFTSSYSVQLIKERMIGGYLFKKGSVVSLDKSIWKKQKESEVGK